MGFRATWRLNGSPADATSAPPAKTYGRGLYFTSTRISAMRRPLLAILAACGAARADVIDRLTEENFEDIMFYAGRRPAMILFNVKEGEGELAPAPVLALTKAWATLAEEYEEDSAMVIGTVMCVGPQAMPLCNKYLGQPNKYPVPAILYFGMAEPDAEPDVYEGKRTAKALLAFARELLCNPHTLEGCSDAAKKEIAPLAAMPLPELRTTYKALRKEVVAARDKRCAPLCPPRAARAPKYTPTRAAGSTRRTAYTRRRMTSGPTTPRARSGSRSSSTPRRCVQESRRE